MSKLATLNELARFLRKRKAYWIGPVVVVLLLLGVLLVATEGSALAPFIYSLF